jgi:hypothetical protein
MEHGSGGKRFTNRSRWILGIVLGLLPILLSHQACTSNVSLSVTEKLQSIGSGNMSGNGEAYEDKPKPGRYVRYVPGLTCADQIQRPYAEITINPDSSVKLMTLNFDTCMTQEDPVSPSEFEHSDFNDNFLGYKDGIYEHHEDKTTAPIPAEAWCRIRNQQNEADDIVIKASSANSWDVTVFREQLKSDGTFTAIPPVTFAATREIIDHQVTYKALNFNLTLNLDQLPVAARKDFKVYSHLTDGISTNYILNIDHAPPIPTSQWFGPISYQRQINIPSTVPEGKYYVVDGLTEFVSNNWVDQTLEPGPGVTNYLNNPTAFVVAQVTISSSLPPSSSTQAPSLLADGLGSLIRIFQLTPTDVVVPPGGSFVFSYNWLAPPAKMPSKIQYTTNNLTLNSGVDCRVGGVFDFRSDGKPLQ